MFNRFITHIRKRWKEQKQSSAFVKMLLESVETLEKHYDDYGYYHSSNETSESTLPFFRTARKFERKIHSRSPLL